MRRNNVRRERPATTNKLSAYFSHHIQSLVFSLSKIYQAPATTIMTVAVIGITLSLPGGFYLFLKNFDAMSGDFRSTTKITLYLDLKLDEKNARTLQREIDVMAQVHGTEFVSRHDALESFRESSGFGNSIDTLSNNPLPLSPGWTGRSVCSRL